MRFDKDKIVGELRAIALDARKQNAEAVEEAQKDHDERVAQAEETRREWIISRREAVLKAAHALAPLDPEADDADLNAAVRALRNLFPGANFTTGGEGKFNPSRVAVVYEDAIEELERLADTLALAAQDYLTSTDLKQAGLGDVLGMGMGMGVVKTVGPHKRPWFTMNHRLPPRLRG